MKIDRSFINRVSARDENAEIVRTIVGLASLHMEVIAEGIETKEQLTHLQPYNANTGKAISSGTG
jgi:EAL domain-containing protein (putative c-di-GMP-specific phosphodiesterase class I)